MGRRVGRELVVIDSDTVNLHAAEFGLAARAGSRLRKLGQQRGQRNLRIRRIGVDRHRRHRLDLRDDTRLLRLLVELVSGSERALTTMTTSRRILASLMARAISARRRNSRSTPT